MAKALQLPSLPAHEEIVSRTIEELGTSIAQALEESWISRGMSVVREKYRISREETETMCCKAEHEDRGCSRKFG